MLNPNETNVAQHYNHNGFEYESVRLQEYSPVEFAMTARYFNRWIPEQSTVVDIGVGRSLCRITAQWLFAVPDRHFAETVRHNLCQTQSSQSRATSSQCPELLQLRSWGRNGDRCRVAPLSIIFAHWKRDRMRCEKQHECSNDAIVCRRH